MSFYKSLCVLLGSLSLASCMVSVKPVTTQDVKKRIAKDKRALFEAQEPIGRRLNYYQALARALKYNLAYREKAMELSMIDVERRISSYGMLPEVVAETGYFSRSNQRLVLSPLTNAVSTAEDRTRRVNSLKLSWNILDFGISYYTSKRVGNEFFAHLERRRAVINQIARDVRDAYWNAYIAQYYIPRLHAMVSTIRHAIHKSRAQEAQKLVTAEEAARYRLELWELYRKAHQMRLALEEAKPRLRHLINAPINARFSLAVPDRLMSRIPRSLPGSTRGLQNMALWLRPELLEQDYKVRIGINDIEQAQLEMLPGVPVSFGRYTDSNSFLVNKNWAEITAQLTWNLINIPLKVDAMKLARRKTIKERVHRLALGMMILTQVSVSKVRYSNAIRNSEIARHILLNANKLHRATLNLKQAKLAEEMKILKSKVRFIDAQLGYRLTLLAQQETISELLHAIGFDSTRFVKNINAPIKVLAKQIRLSLIKPYPKPGQVRRLAVKKLKVKKAKS